MLHLPYTRIGALILGIAMLLVFAFTARAGNADAPLQVSFEMGACATDAGLNTLTIGLGTDATDINNGSFAVKALPADAVVVQAWLYWNGADAGDQPEDDPALFNPAIHDGDPTVVLNGIAVQSPERIGGPAFWEPERYAYAYRADVTDLVTANGVYVLGGIDSLETYNNGAQLVIIYQQPSPSARLIAVADGLDLAFGRNSPTSGPGSRAAIFTFDSASSARVAQVTVFVGGAGVLLDQNTAVWHLSGSGVPPANNIIGAAGASQIENPFTGIGNQNVRPYWDSYHLSIQIPAGAEWLAVQAESGANPSPQLEWVGALLSLPLDCPLTTPTLTPTPDGDQTATPTHTPTSLPTATPTSSPTSDEQTPTPTSTFTVTATPTNTSTPTATPQSVVCATSDPDEPNNRWEDAASLTPNTPARPHYFENDGDQDWFVFSTTAGATYTMTTSNLSVAPGVDADTTLHLFQPPDFAEQDAIAYNDDAGETSASQIVWTAPSSGDFYVVVNEYFQRGNCRRYDFQLESSAGVGYTHYLPIWLKTPSNEPTVTPTPTRKLPPSTSTPTPTTGAGETPTVITLPNAGAARGVAVNPVLGRVYITGTTSDSLYVLDANTLALLTTVPVCDAPFGVDVNTNTGRVYVACEGPGSLAILDGANNTLIGTLSVGAKPSYVAVNESTNMAYVVTRSNNSVVAINGNSNTVAATWAASSGAFGVAVNETLNHVYVTNRVAGTVVTFAGATGVQLASHQFSPGGGLTSVPAGLGFDENRQFLYVSYADSGIFNQFAAYQVTPAGVELAATTTVGNGAKDVAGRIPVQPSTGISAVLNSADRTVSILDAATHQVSATLSLTSRPLDSDIHSASNRLFVSTDSGQLWAFALP